MAGTAFSRLPLRAAAAALLALGLLGAVAAHAGRRCETARLSPQAVERGLHLAQKTADALDTQHARDGTRVVLLARMGQDLSRWGQRWSHLGYAVKTAEGPWRVVHKLNECGGSQSLLARQGLGEFFMDDVWRHEAAWLAPPRAWQDALWPLLHNSQRLRVMDEPRYSLVSYAWGTRYQQSNQWLLETLALAADPRLAGRAQAQAWLQRQGYQPAVLNIGPLTRLGGRVAAGNVAFDDHPGDKRFANRIETITADSVLTWLAALQPGSALGQVRL